MSEVHPARMEMGSGESAARAFCSTANLGAGFDVFGLALDRYADTVSVRFIQSRKIRITAKGPFASALPTTTDLNSAGPPAAALLRRARSQKGLTISIDKNVPPGLGLGSSGATAAACAKAVDSLLELGTPSNELLQIASLGEEAVSGTAHADNVGASLLGGFVIVYDKPVKATSLQPPSGLRVVVITPKVQVGDHKTRRARKLVPRIIETKKAVLNVGRAAAITAGFAQHDIPLIGSGMIDEIAEPYRREVIPGYYDVRRLALDEGGKGVAISGAGPSLVCLVDKKTGDPHRVAEAMMRGFQLNGIRSTSFVARPAPGARIVKRR
jgi:homoserine kinase